MSAQYDDVHALIDGELEGQEKTACLERLKNCPVTRAEREWAESVKTCLKSKCVKSENHDLFVRSMAQVRAIEKSRRAEAFVGRYAWAGASVIVATIFVAAIFSRISGPGQLASTNVASMLGTGLSVMPGSESDPQTLLESTFGKVSCDIPSYIVAREVARGEIEGRQAVRIRAADTYGQLVMFVIQGGRGFSDHSRLSGDYKTGRINGATSVAWSEGGMDYLLLGARSAGDLAKTADVIRAR
jgi:hypothetical protein